MECTDCGEYFPRLRANLGYKLCLACGEEQARSIKHCIVPLHKSNYTVITDPKLLRGINNKTLRG